MNDGKEATKFQNIIHVLFWQIIECLCKHPLPHAEPCFACSLRRLLLGCGTTSSQVHEPAQSALLRQSTAPGRPSLTSEENTLHPNKKRDGRDYPKVDRTLRGSEDLNGGAKCDHQARGKEGGNQDGPLLVAAQLWHAPQPWVKGGRENEPGELSAMYQGLYHSARTVFRKICFHTPSSRVKVTRCVGGKFHYR